MDLWRECSVLSLYTFFKKGIVDDGEFTRNVCKFVRLLFFVFIFQTGECILCKMTETNGILVIGNRCFFYYL